jgi:hypothetical protein
MTHQGCQRRASAAFDNLARLSSKKTAVPVCEKAPIGDRRTPVLLASRRGGEMGRSLKNA